MYKKLSKLYWFLAILPLVITVIIFPYISDQIPMHYGLDGNVNRYGSKYELFIIPLISIIIAFGIPYLSKRYPKYDISAKVNKILNNLLFVILNIINISILYSAYTMSKTLDSNLGLKLLNCMIPVLLMIMGNYLPKTSPNPVFGVRVKATLNDEEVWYKTHRFTGKLWMISGVPALIICMWSSFEIGTIISLIFLTVDVIVPIIYANKIYKYKHKAK